MGTVVLLQTRSYVFPNGHIWGTLGELLRNCLVVSATDTRRLKSWLYQPSASENLLVADSSADFIFARFAASIAFS